MKSLSLFFDDGGVLNHNQTRGAKWKEFVYQYFSPQYGGSREEWGKANDKAVMYEIELMNNHNFERLEDFYKHINEYWTVSMFKDLGIEIPDDPIIVTKEAESWILPKTASPFEDIIEIIKSLAGKYSIYTASNETSEELHMYLTAMGIRDCFESQLFGPDLINVHKSEEYYQLMFSTLEIEPNEAVIIEDAPHLIKIIEKSGATPIQSRQNLREKPVTRYHFDHATQLPAIIKTIEGIKNQ